MSINAAAGGFFRKIAPHDDYCVLDMPHLELIDVSKAFNGVYAVTSMNLAVKEGEFVCLLGPSGCGKTTTLHMIAGFEEPTTGKVLLAGRDVTNFRPNQRGLGIVFQSYALFPHMTVSQNISFGLEMRKVRSAEREQRVKKVLDIVHLTEYRDRYPRELSGGQRQRVALARALVIEPPVLLLDEPLSNLDAKLREVMQIELRRIQQQVGITTIMVTHDQAEALSISDRVMVMERGRATQYDTPLNVYENPQSPFISTFVGKANMLKGDVLMEGGKYFATVSGMKLALDVDRCDGPRPSPGQQVILSLRPEKLFFTEPGRGFFDAQVKEKFFFGSQWHYTVMAPLGTLTVLQPNDGRQPNNVGDNLGIGWGESCLRIVPDPENLGIFSAI
jgi:putative spermidine/putrescine transport system ATP-binding protein